MCDPVSGALLGVSLAAMAGSTALSSSASNKAAAARNKAMRQEQQRQQGFRTNAAQVFDKSLASQDRPVQETDAANVLQKREASLADAVKAASEYAPTTGSAPKIVNAEIARRLGQALKSGTETSKRLAALGTFNDLQFNNRLALNDSSSKIGMYGDFAGGSSRVLPLELMAAQQKGQGLRTFGDILGGVGQVAGMAGSTGAFDSWFKAAPAMHHGSIPMGR